MLRVFSLGYSPFVSPTFTGASASDDRLDVLRGALGSSIELLYKEASKIDEIHEFMEACETVGIVRLSTMFPSDHLGE